MIDLPGLTPAQMNALKEDLRRGPYIAKPVGKILDLDHRELSDISDRILDGQIDAQGVTTSMNISLFDPRRTIALDGANPAAGAIFYNKMLQVGMQFKGPRLGRVVTIPLFCGPFAGGSRSGATSSFTCMDKSILANRVVWETMVFKKGTRKVDAIRDLLIATGEAPARIKCPALTNTFAEDLAVTATDPAWASVKAIATSMSYQATYDARGDFRLKKPPAGVAAVFADGEGGNVLGDPQITYPDYTQVNNGVRVLGATVGGKRIVSAMWLPNGHPLSPVARARGGVPHRAPYTIDDTQIGGQAEADAKAYAYINSFAREVVEATVEVMPNWLLEPFDGYALQTQATGNIAQRLTAFSMPLTPGASMTLGANRPIARPRPTKPKPPKKKPKKPRGTRGTHGNTAAPTASTISNVRNF